MLDFKSAPKHKSGRGPSSEHFWQVWLKSVQRFQRRRFKCEKLTDGRRTLTHDKSSHGLWPGELKRITLLIITDRYILYGLNVFGQNLVNDQSITDAHWENSINKFTN